MKYPTFHAELFACAAKDYDYIESQKTGIPVELRRYLLLLNVDARVALEGVQGLYELDIPPVPFAEIPLLYSQFNLHAHARMFESINRKHLVNLSCIPWDNLTKSQIDSLIKEFDEYQKQYNYEEVQLLKIDVIWEYLKFFKSAKSFIEKTI